MLLVSVCYGYQCVVSISVTGISILWVLVYWWYHYIAGIIVLRVSVCYIVSELRVSVCHGYPCVTVISALRVLVYYGYQCVTANSVLRASVS